MGPKVGISPPWPLGVLLLLLLWPSPASPATADGGPKTSKLYVYPFATEQSAEGKACYQSFWSETSAQGFWKQQDTHWRQYYVDVFMARFLHQHPLTTTDPAAATLFVVPLIPRFWLKLPEIDWCVQHYVQRVHNSSYYQRSQGRDHVILDFYGRLEGNDFVNSYYLGTSASLCDGPRVSVPQCLRRPPLALRLSHTIVLPCYQEATMTAQQVPVWEARKQHACWVGNAWQYPAVRLPMQEALRQLPASSMGDLTDLMKLGDVQKTLSQCKYCMVPRGANWWTCRLYTAILAGCVPVVFSDGLTPAFADVLNYSALSVWKPQADINTTIAMLGTLPPEVGAAMHQEVLRARMHFAYNESSPAAAVAPGGPLDMTVRALLNVQHTLLNLWLQHKNRLMTWTKRFSYNFLWTQCNPYVKPGVDDAWRIYFVKHFGKHMKKFFLREFVPKHCEPKSKEAGRS